MNGRKLLDALGNIDEKYLGNEELLEKTGPKKTRKSRWKLGLAAGLAAALLALVILLLANAAPSRLALTVYAMGTDGSLTERPMPESLSLPVSLIEADDGTAGFLFSVPVDDPAATVGILPVGDASFDSGAVKTITSTSLAPGRAYYFLVGRAASEIQEATICHRKSASNIFLIHVTIEKTEDGYLAKWEEVQKLGQEALEMPAAETDQA